MQAPDMLSLVLTWGLANAQSLAVLGGLAVGFIRLSRFMDRKESESRTLAKLARLHALVHPLHAGVLYNPELTEKDIDEENVDQCHGSKK